MSQLILFNQQNDEGEKEFQSLQGITKLSFTNKPVSPYYPKGTGRTFNQYFRFSYRDGEQMKHLHIPGGNTRNPLAISRAKEVLAFIDKGATVSQVKSLIESWQKRPVKSSENTLF